MSIYSYKYIIAFFILFWVYWLLCKKKNTQNALLLLASYVFYGLWDWRCLFLLFATSIVAYGAGVYFKKNPEPTKSFLHKSTRWWVSCGAVAFSLTVLGYFKYANFFLQSISDLSGGGVGTSLLILYYLLALAFILSLQSVILLTAIRRS